MAFEHRDSGRDGPSKPLPFGSQIQENVGVPSDRRCSGSTASQDSSSTQRTGLFPTAFTSRVLIPLRTEAPFDAGWWLNGSFRASREIPVGRPMRSRNESDGDPSPTLRDDRRRCSVQGSPASDSGDLESNSQGMAVIENLGSASGLEPETASISEAAEPIAGPYSLNDGGAF